MGDDNYDDEVSLLIFQTVTSSKIDQRHDKAVNSLNNSKLFNQQLPSVDVELNFNHL